MDHALFLSQSSIYGGHYSITKRDALHEFSQPLHFHDFYEVQFYLSDEENANIGEITVNGKTCPLTHGCLVLINMFSPHQVHITTQKPYVRYCISFDSSLLLFACSESANLFSVFSGCMNPAVSKSLMPSQINTFIQIYARHENLNLRNGRDIMEKSIILEIFAHIYDIFYEGREIKPEDSRNMQVVTKLIGYIDEHISEDLSLETLAAYASFSTYYLNRMFKHYTGTTLNRYIITKRIDRAKLLLKSAVPVTNINKEIGYDSYSHFYRTFKKVTGMSPTEYKKG